MFSGSTVLLLGLFQLAVGIILGVCLANWLGGRRRDPRRLYQRPAAPETSSEPAAIEQAYDKPTGSEESAAISASLEEPTALDSAALEEETDPETGLPNRGAFEYYLYREVAVARRRGHPLCLVLCESDQAGAVREQQGDLVGAAVMRSLAERLASQLHDGPIVARYGDARFAVVLTGCDEPAGTGVAEGLLRSLAVVTLGDEVNGTIEASVTIALAELRADDDSDSLTRRAELALEAARRAGGACAYLHNGANCEAIEETPSGTPR